MKIFTTDTTNKTVISTANLVAQAVKDGKKCIVFAEDKITLSLELEIAKSLGGGFFDVQVLTFKRYIAGRNQTAKMLSKESSVMAVRKIIADIASELCCFKAQALGVNMATTLYELISQLESAKVTPKALYDIIDKNEGLTPALYNKLCDIALIYKTYDEYVKDRGFLDSNDYLSLAPSLILSDAEIKNSTVIIAGFQSVTKQRYDVFSALNTQAKEFFAVVPYDKNCEVYTGETYQKLLKICPSAHVDDLCGNLTCEAEAIKKYLFNPEVYSENFKPIKTENVTLYEAYDRVEEIEWLAKDLLSEVRKNGYRFKDVAVSVGSLDETLPLITRCFQDYGIPFFVEKSTSLAEHPIISYIVAFLDFQRKGLALADFIKIVCSGLFIADKTVSDAFLIALMKNPVSRKAFKVAFEKPELLPYENYRRTVISCVSRLAKAKTVKDYVLAVKGVLNDTNACENLEKLTENLNKIGERSIADFNEKALEKTLSVLDEMEGVLGALSISALDFKNVFLSGAQATMVGAIPILNDAVYVGECKDVKIKNAKILYGAGLNGDIPFTKSDTSLLTDGDLSKLDEFNVIVEPKIKAVNDREKENVTVTLASFSDKLKISYSVVDSTLSINKKSEAVKYLSLIFDLQPITKQQLKNHQGGYLSNGFVNDQTALKEIASLYGGYMRSEKSAMNKVASFYEAVKMLKNDNLIKKADQLFSEKPVPSVDGAIVKKAIGDEISATTLETYFSCPYKSFAKQILRLKDTETGEVKANETGTLLHEIVELYVKNINRVKDKASSNALVKETIENLKKQPNYAKFTANPRLEFALERAENEAYRTCFDVFTSLQNSKFKPLYYEKEFGNDKDIPAISLNSKSGKTGVKGTVDRVDEYNGNVRVIDYKTGHISGDDESFYTGNKIQLYLYMNAFTGEKFKPSGTYYYPVRNEFSSSGESPAMVGKTVADDDVISATDLALTSGMKSKVVDIAKKKDGALAKTSKVISRSDLEKYLKYAIKLSENGVDEIRSGYVNPTPYDGACTYCQYGGMCGFCEKEGGLYRKEKIDKSTIVTAVDDEEKSTYKAKNGEEND